MKLSKSPAQYSEQHQDQLQREILSADGKNLKSDQIFASLRFKDTADGSIKTLVITSGAVVVS